MRLKQLATTALACLMALTAAPVLAGPPQIPPGFVQGSDGNYYAAGGTGPYAFNGSVMTLLPVNAVSASGVYNLNAASLPHWRAAVARVRAGTGRGRLLMVGDSTTQGYGAQGSASAVGDWPLSPVSALSKLLSTYYVQTSVANFFGDTNALGAGTTYALYDTRFTMGANWTESTTHPILGGDWFQYDNLAVTNITFTPTTAFDTVICYNWKASPGTFHFNVDGGASLGTSTGGSTGYQALSSTVAKATHTINIVPDNNGAIFFAGILAYDSTAPSIDVMQEGFNGSTIASYLGSSQPYNAIPAIQFLAPDETVINETINDIVANGVAGIPAYTIKVQSLITAAQASGDVILMMGVPSSTNTATDLAAYRAALMGLALANNVPFIDLSTRWVSYAFTNPIMPYGAGVHPGVVGIQDEAQAIYDALTRYQ